MKLHGKLNNNALKVTAVFFPTKPKLTQEEGGVCDHSHMSVAPKV
jgi:hypothetical protein